MDTNTCLIETETQTKGAYVKRTRPKKRSQETQKGRDSLMAKSLSAQRFLDSKEAKEIREILKEMMTDPEFNTKSMYSPAAGGDVLFVDKHMEYLSQHTTLNVTHYLSNLRLMTRVRK